MGIPRILLVCLVGTWLAAFSGLLLANHRATVNFNDATVLQRLLNPQLPITVRRHAAHQAMQFARQGDERAQFVLGSLYMWGTRNPGSPMPRDPGKAELLLANAAVHGPDAVLAMAAMAELELAEKRPLQATIWAEMYANYSQVTGVQLNGYAAELLLRCFRLLPSGSMGIVRRDQQSLVARFDHTIRAGIKPTPVPGKSVLHFLPHAQLYIDSSLPAVALSKPIPKAGLAVYFAVFGPDGRVQGFWLVNAFPQIGLGRQLRASVFQLRVSGGQPEADGNRYALIPIVFSDGRYSLAHVK